jgi:hypothetical protein
LRVVKDDGTEPSLVPFVVLLRAFGGRARTRSVLHQLDHGASGDDPVHLDAWFDFEKPGKYRIIAARWFRYFDDSGNRWVHARAQSSALEIELSADLAICTESNGGEPR